ncbi:MAG: YqgE/AlgH family protein [Candidatus Melainabacteria bacterium]|nr:YqgE/AlgH family protein [Candidatus Melainabacteria bacterium]
MENLAGSVFYAGDALNADPVFGGSVILMINETMGVNLCGTIFSIPNFDLQLQDGGPLAAPYIFAIFDNGDDLTVLHPIGDSGYSLRPVTVDDGKIAPVFEPSKGFLTVGYAGWGAGQFQEELDFGAWLPAQCSLRELMAVPPHLRYSKAAGEAQEGDLEEAPQPIVLNLELVAIVTVESDK